MLRRTAHASLRALRKPARLQLQAVRKEHTVEVAKTVEQARGLTAKLRKQGKTIAFVPTMGALHSGHVYLAKRGLQECQSVVVSIFVNPTQFGPHEDFSRYPRTLEADLDKLRAARVDGAFVPEFKDMYLPNHGTWVSVDGVDNISEGKARPGHFRGVATVVTKLLNIVQPDVALFGQKDALQSIVVRRIARELNMPTRVVIGETQREPDGLAMSSRNVYLSAEERAAAPVLYRALRHAASLHAAGQRDLAALRQAVHGVIAAGGRDTGVPCAAQYISVADTDTGAELPDSGALEPGRTAIASVAMSIGSKGLRLLDNIYFGAPPTV